MLFKENDIVRMKRCGEEGYDNILNSAYYQRYVNNWYPPLDSDVEGVVIEDQHPGEDVLVNWENIGSFWLDNHYITLSDKSEEDKSNYDFIESTVSFDDMF